MAEVENQSEGVRPGDQSEKLYNKVKESNMKKMH